MKQTTLMAILRKFKLGEYDVGTSLWETAQEDKEEHFIAMFKSSQLVTFVQQMVGQPYWYGTCVYQCTNSLLSSKSKQYTSHYGSNRTARYKQDIANRRVCMDCIGMIKGFFWTNGG